MQKRLIALAIASMATSAAFAQSADTVTLYGRVDLGLTSLGGKSNNVGADKRTLAMASGIQAGSRIGVRGVENLGNGMSALFQAEFGIAADQQGGPTTRDVNGVVTSAGSAAWWSRNSYLGLKTNGGTVLLGRLDGLRYGVMNRADAFGGGTVGNFASMTTQVDRADNAIAYVSPTFNGFTATLAYSTKISGTEALGNIGDDRLTEGLLSYKNGGLLVELDMAQIKPKSGTSKIRAGTLAAGYDFGVAKVSALFDELKVTNSGVNAAKERSYLVSAKVPLGKAAVKATVGQVQNKLSGASSNDKATKVGLGLDYSISKRTGVFVDFGKITNKGSYGKQISTSGWGNGNRGTNGFDVGIAHTF